MFGKEKKTPRFVVKETHTVGLGLSCLSVICDTETGVNYLASGGDNFTLSCITPLLDKSGNVVIDRQTSEIF